MASVVASGLDPGMVPVLAVAVLAVLGLRIVSQLRRARAERDELDARARQVEARARALAERRASPRLQGDEAGPEQVDQG
jgi:hypothetical protein